MGGCCSSHPSDDEEVFRRPTHQYLQPQIQQQQPQRTVRQVVSITESPSPPPPVVVPQRSYAHQFLAPISPAVVTSPYRSVPTVTRTSTTTTTTTVRNNNTAQNRTNARRQSPRRSNQGRRGGGGGASAVRQIIFTETLLTTCEACGESDHLTETCRYRERLCFYCREEGHIIAVCPAKKRQRLRNQTQRRRGKR